MSIGSHQRTIGRSQVHITPRHIVDALGLFDLDPCAADPRPWDCASANYTESMDGLALPWRGRVWLNPPFDRRTVGAWVERMAAHRNGIALLHARTETAWFLPIWRDACALLFLADRLVFCKQDGTPQTISNPASKYFGKAANSGAPVVLAAFSASDVRSLSSSGISGALVTRWERRWAEAA